MTTHADRGMAADATLLHVGDPARGEIWQALLPSLVPGLQVRQWPDIGDPANVRYVAAWQPPSTLFRDLPALDLIFSVGAGTDHIDTTALPADVPLIRMIEPGLTQGMVEYATFAVLALHRGILGHIARQRQALWVKNPVMPAAHRRVGILGLGAIGSAIATRLATFGFPVTGYSRSPHRVDGITSVAGTDALPGFLAATDILICVLPLTPATHHFINADLLAMLPVGASIVNIGRGGHLDEAALRASLDAGHIAGAVLDVAEQEPPPPDHWFWADPRILLTPHIAGTTDPAGAAAVIADTIRRYRTGEPLVGVVDPARGY